MLEKITARFTRRTQAQATRDKGGHYEALARDFLRTQGLTDFHFNFHSRYGEIDLIARDGDCLVFVEVRYRHSSGHGSAVASVTRRKQEKLRSTAQHFLQKHGLTNRMPCRFDVVGISGDARDPQFRWIKNAF